MPFGLCNTPGTFQRAMMAIFCEFLGSSMEVFMDDFTVYARHTKLRLLRWILLLQEFHTEIKDRSGAANHVADHLSRIPAETRGVSDSDQICDEFPAAILFSMAKHDPWYANMVNFLVTDLIPASLSHFLTQKLKCEAKYYIWDPPILWRMCNDQIIRRCVPNEEVQSVLEACHSWACGGHFSAKKTSTKDNTNNMWLDNKLEVHELMTFSRILIEASPYMEY